jgi:hypothetical protein
MNATNRHTVELEGDTFKEMADEALEVFDAYFGREEGLVWNVADINVGLHVELRTGCGEAIKRVWRGSFTAEIHEVKIGTQSLSHAMRFSA